MELRSSKLSLQSLMTAQLPLKIHNISQNPVVTNSGKIWIQFRKHLDWTNPLPQPLVPPSLLALDPVQKCYTSMIYNSIDSLNSDQTTHLKQIWEHEISVPIPDNWWDSILDLVHSSSMCAKHGLLQCKVLFRVHYTNARLTKKKKCTQIPVILAIGANSCLLTIVTCSGPVQF